MSDRLNPNNSLGVNASITSENGQYKFIYQSDGNLVLYRNRDGKPLWASRTDGKPAKVCIMQSDGNLVIYAPDGHPIWASNTDNNPGSFLIVQNDGNVVIYRKDNTPIWATNTVQPTLNPNDSLGVNNWITSENGQYKFIYQSDGNLVLYRIRIRDGKPLWAPWASGTDGKPAKVCIMQSDGNLVIYAPDGHPIWASNTDNNPGSFLIVQNDGNVVIYRKDNTPIWATNTVQSAIDDKYAALGGSGGFLGAPTAPETPTPDGKGRFRQFQGGSIYWSPQTGGADEVHGAIRDKYLALGGPGSFLGYPISDETTAGDFDGRVNFFQGGPIYWTSETGAHEMHDETILDKWLDMSDSLIPGRSVLGWPTSDVYGSVGSFRQDFQNGYITDINNRATSYCRIRGTGCDHIIGGPPTGVSQVVFFNCNSDRRAVYIWINDLTAGSGWQNQGQLEPQYDEFGTCPAAGASPLTITLQDGHQYELAAVDPEGVTCSGQNDPTVVGCRRWSSVLTGSSQGPVVPVTIS